MSNTISATHFVSVTTLIAAAAITRFGFGKYMIVDEHNVSTARQEGPFADITDVEDAGFTEADAPELYYAASAAFAVANPVDELYIGRKIPSAGGALDAVWSVDVSTDTFTEETTDSNDAGVGDITLFPASEAIGDYVVFISAAPFTSLTFDNTGGTAGVDGGSLAVAWEYWNGAAWVAVSGLSDGTSAFTAAVSAGQVVSFTAPTNWALLTVETSDPGYALRCRLTAGAWSTNPIYDTVVITADASWTTALSAIEAVGDEWYGHTIGSRESADIVAVAAWTESRFHRFIPQSADATFLSGTAGNVALLLQAAGYKRTMGPLYHAVSSGSANGYLDAAMASAGFGFDLDAENGHDNWMFQTLAGITADSLDNAQAVNIWAAAGNLYGNTFGSSFISKGTTAAGAPYFQDTQSAIDWFTRRVQEDIVEHFVAVRPDYENVGIQGIANVVQDRLDNGVTVGAFSKDFPRVVTVPDASEISSTTKGTRVLTLRCSAVFAGKIQKLDLTLNVEF